MSKEYKTTKPLPDCLDQCDPTTWRFSMKKHYYLHSPDIEIRNDLIKSKYLQHPMLYSIADFSDTHANEFGRFETHNAFYHILIGQIKNENCPWCDGIVDVIEVSKTVILGMINLSLTVRCSNCHSQGPEKTFCLSEKMYADSTCISEVYSLLKEKYMNRKTFLDHIL